MRDHFFHDYIRCRHFFSVSHLDDYFTSPFLKIGNFDFDLQLLLHHKERNFDWFEYLETRRLMITVKTAYGLMCTVGVMFALQFGNDTRFLPFSMALFSN